MYPVDTARVSQCVMCLQGVLDGKRLKKAVKAALKPIAKSKPKAASKLIKVGRIAWARHLRFSHNRGATCMLAVPDF